MSSFKVGDGTQLIREPSVDDLAAQAESLKLIDALGVRTDINVFGIGGVDIKHQPTRAMAKTELPGIIGAIADTPPSKQ